MRDPNKLDRYITGNYGEDQFKNTIHPATEAFQRLLQKFPMLSFRERALFDIGWNEAIQHCRLELELEPDDVLVECLTDTRD